MHSLFAILKMVFTHEIRRQMLACFETLANVIQSAPMADFTFGSIKGSFLLRTGQKHLRSLSEDRISNSQHRIKGIYQKQRRHGRYKTFKPIFLNMS